MVLLGPSANSNCFEKRSSLQAVGNDLWLTFQDSSLFRLTTVSLLVPLTPSPALCFTFSNPSSLSISCQKQSLSMNQWLVWLLTLYLSYIQYFFPTEKENPYEDVDLKRKILGRKSCLLESSRSWTAMDKKLSSPPQVSQKSQSTALCYVMFPLIVYQCWIWDEVELHISIVFL